MKRSRSQKKATLMAKAEELIEQLLNWDENTPRPTLTQIEDIILEMRKAMGEEMAEVVLEGQEQKAPVPEPACPACGKAMRYKGQRENQVESRLGAIDLERGYYTCPECGQGIFPPGSTTGVLGQELE